MKKDDRGMYINAIRELDLTPSEVIMVGDSFRNDVLGPKMVGINSFLLDRNNVSHFVPRIFSIEDVLLF